MIEFSFADIADIPALMQFMHQHWRKEHVLARRADMWNYEFNSNGFQLNVGIVKERGQIIGLFGFIPYNSQPVPDIAGSLWKVTDDAQKRHPMLGLRLRQWVLQQVKHQFFAAPGAGLQTQPIYRLLGMQWHRMAHYYRLNPNFSQYQLVKPDVPLAGFDKLFNDPDWDCLLINDILQLEVFPFSRYKKYKPFKDMGYIRKRFLEYPFAEYELLMAKNKDKDKWGLIVVRRAKALQASALRIIDFLGDEEALQPLIRVLDTQMLAKGDEFLDMVCYGLDDKTLKNSGMKRLDFNQDFVVIPNYFEPFEMRNVPVYCVADSLPNDYQYRQFKGDGDQDRPNMKGLCCINT